MTVRRKDTGEVEELLWGPKTKAYRLVLLGAALAATPFGQSLLNNVGVRTPVMAEVVTLTDKVAGVSDKVVTVTFDVSKLKDDLSKVKDDIAAVKVDTAAVKSEQANFKQVFSGFQVDFDKYRKEPK